MRVIEKFITVPDWILASAVRYSLGRRTYVVDEITSITRLAWDKLSAFTKGAIARDIEQFVEDRKRGGGTLDPYTRLWEDLWEFIKAQPATDSGNDTLTTWDWVLISAVRYTLESQTHIVSQTCSVVKDVWGELSDNTRLVISRDVKKFIDDHPESPTDLFSPVDLDEWKDLDKFIQQEA